MKYYVTTDPHAHYTPLAGALRAAGYFEDAGEKRLLVCGDLLDRGKEPLAVVDFLMAELAAHRLTIIRGNHEDLLEDALESIADGYVMDVSSCSSHHVTNGTWQTLLALSGMNEDDALRYPKRLVNLVRQSPFYRELLPCGVDFYETEHHIFTHGWIPTRTEGYRPYVRHHYDPDWRHAPSDLWRQARWLNGMAMACKHRILEPGKCIVCGHYATAHGHALYGHGGSENGVGADYSPFSAEGILALDACTVVSGQVNCWIVEDTPI